METIITACTVIAAIGFGVLVFKLATHPTAGKIQHYYQEQYNDFNRRNLPPF